MKSRKMTKKELAEVQAAGQEYCDKQSKKKGKKKLFTFLAVAGIVIGGSAYVYHKVKVNQSEIEPEIKLTAGNPYANIIDQEVGSADASKFRTEERMLESTLGAYISAVTDRYVVLYDIQGAKVYNKGKNYYLELIGETCIGSLNNTRPEKMTMSISEEKASILKKALKNKDWGIDISDEEYDKTLSLRKDEYFLPALYETFYDTKSQLQSIQNTETGKMIFERDSKDLVL